MGKLHSWLIVVKTVISEEALGEVQGQSGWRHNGQHLVYAIIGHNISGFNNKHIWLKKSIGN